MRRSTYMTETKNEDEDVELIEEYNTLTNIGNNY
jgi:hypothetical protein